MQRHRPAAPIVRVLLAATLAAAFAGPARAADTMVEFVVVRADTLIGLSNSVLVSPTAWREVARLNKLQNVDRILPGQRLRIPARLLRGDAVSAKLVSVTGDVRSGDTPLAVGSALNEGQSVQTGPNGSAVVELADGSRVRLPPSSLAEVAASRNFGGRLPAGAAASAQDAAAANAPSHWFAGTMRVLRGSVEVFATKVLRAKPLEVVTPTAVVGVRGTQYRVAFDDTATRRTHAEVLEGAVNFDAAGAAGSTALTAGFGASTDGAGPPSPPTRLLPPPDLTTLPERFERPIVRFALPGEPAPLRVQVAADPAFDRMVSDQLVAAGAEVRIAGLDDAQWYVRARRVDAQGIEGFDSARPFVLKARPEPPAYRAPRTSSKQAVGAVEFAWAPNVDAPRARLQVAEDEAFTRIVEDRDNVDTSALNATLARPGTYFWRLASVRPSGDHGPFGDPQRFELRPHPEPAAVARSADGGALVFRWSGARPEDKQQVEFARDLEFTQIVTRAEVSGSEWALPMPGSGGRYYFRYRSVEPDGFVTPYSEKLQVDVPRDWSGLGLLLPLLLLF
ncbi:MAG: FecR domain-containing protein [Pseudomonadota bacterium]